MKCVYLSKSNYLLFCQDPLISLAEGQFLFFCEGDYENTNQ